MSEPRMIGNYRIVELLGTGAMGAVHVGVDVNVEREVAIKSMRPELTRDSDFVGRFRAEATSLARLNHPNITTLYSLIQEKENLYMVMELVRGRPLDEVLKERGSPLGVRESLAIVSQVADGLSYAHQSGVIHRDVKPSNLMIANDGRVKIMDFGIARVRGSVRQTRVGEAVGTPLYMSPEQCKGGEGDERSDLYSLALVLYEMLSGAPPFNNPVEYEIIRAQINAQPAPLVPRIAGVSAKLEAAIMTALAKQPDQRFPNVRAFGDAIGATALRVDAPAIIGDAKHLIEAPAEPPAAAGSKPTLVAEVVASRFGSLARWFKGLHPAIQGVGVGVGAVAILYALLFHEPSKAPVEPPQFEKTAARRHESNPSARDREAIASTTGVDDRAPKPVNCNDTYGATTPCVESKVPELGRPVVAAAPSEKAEPTVQEFLKERRAENYGAALGLALELLKRGDYPEVQTELGVMYLNGLGTPKDVRRAKELFERAARKNDPRAQVNLAGLYQNGDLDNGVSNETAALPYWMMAADNGSAKAQFWLGCYYLHGRGRLREDRQKADELFEKASAQKGADALEYAAKAGLARDYLNARAARSPCK